METEGAVGSEELGGEPCDWLMTSHAEEGELVLEEMVFIHLQGMKGITRRL